MNKRKIGFIGAGSMAEALIKGILSSELIYSDKVYVSDIDDQRLLELENKYQVTIAKDNDELVTSVDYIVLAVKPKTISKVLSKVGSKVKPTQKIFSIAAGVTTNKIQSYVDEGVPVVRLMPNTPALIGEGATAYTLGQAATKQAGEIVQQIFSSVGSIVKVEEELMDAVTGLSGSGPAYIYLLIEALADAGVNVGLKRDDALKLVLQTVIGSAKTVVESGEHPSKLKDMVTSPGGTTITGLKKLEECGFRSALYQAVEEATNKSKQLRGSE